MGAAGVAEPGETGRLAVELWNGDARDSEQVVATLRVLSPAAGVTVLAGMTRWPAVGPGELALDEGVLRLALDATIECSPVVMALDFESSSGATWTEEVTLPLGVGRAQRAGAFDVDLLGESVLQLGWNGTHVGAAWWRPFGGGQVVFSRHELDGTRVDGEQLVLPSDGTDREAALAWGGDAWAVARGQRNGILLSLVDVDGTLRRETWVADPDGRHAAWIGIAWDGLGWGVTFRSSEADGERGAYYAHVAADGALDVGPRLLDLGFEPTGGLTRPTWTGQAHAVVACDQDDRCRLARVERDGALQHLGPALPAWGGGQPVLAGATHGFVLARPWSPWVSVAGLAPDGSLEWGPRVLDPTSPEESEGIGEDSTEHLVLTWDGTGYGLSVTRHVLGLSVGTDDEWLRVRHYWLDARGRRWTHSDATVQDAFGEHSAVPLRGSGTYVPEAQEFLVPVARGDVLADQVFGRGKLRAQAFARPRECFSGAAPGEVSGPDSGVPVLVRKGWGPSCGPCGDVVPHVILSVEDLGSGVGYNVFTWTRADVLAEWTCHELPGESWRVAPGGAGRLDVSAWIDGLGVEADLVFMLVSASNEWGEGTLGRRSSGAERGPPHRCLRLQP